MGEEDRVTVVVALDEKGTVAHANAAAEQLLGSGSLQGTTIWSRLPEPERSRIRKACERAMVEGQAVQFEDPLRFEDRWFRPEAFPMAGNVILHLNDVSAEKRWKNELQLRERALREACGTVADTEAGPRERIKELLTSIRGTLGTEFATLSYVDPGKDRYHFDCVGAACEEELPEGEAVSLDELPICARVAREEESLVLHDVEAEAPELVDPTWGFSSYIGSPVRLGGEVYGTFCFYSTVRRSEGFTDWEETYVELFSDFVSAELDRLVAETASIEPPLLSG